MKGFCTASVIALALSSLLAGCAGDDASPGARDLCAQGGELNDCPDTERTVEAVCWRLVDCGAIAVNGSEDFSLDWGTCMDRLEDTPADRRRLVVNCIAASTCDQLRVDGSPTNPNTEQMYCISLGRDF
jgi:hypothetical protein